MFWRLRKMNFENIFILPNVIGDRSRRRFGGILSKFPKWPPHGLPYCTGLSTTPRKVLVVKMRFVLFHLLYKVVWLIKFSKCIQQSLLWDDTVERSKSVDVPTTHSTTIHVKPPWWQVPTMVWCTLGRCVQGQSEKSEWLQPVLGQCHNSESCLLIGLYSSINHFLRISLFVVYGRYTKNDPKRQKSLTIVKIQIQSQFWNQFWSLIPKMVSDFIFFC